jgi:hypothetical protein
MLLHIDASKHAWFQDDRYYDLITILDDATSEIYYVQLVAEEGTRTLMPAVWEVIEKQGIFCALYSDRASHFFVTPKAGGKVDPQQVTQTGQGFEGAGHSDDSGLLAAGARTYGEELSHLARTAATGVANPTDWDRGRSQPLLREEYRAEFNRRFSVSAPAQGQRLRAHPAKRFAMGVLAAAGAHGDRTFPQRLRNSWPC